MGDKEEYSRFEDWNIIIRAMTLKKQTNNVFTIAVHRV